jgi:hypothetical protein
MVPVPEEHVLEVMGFVMPRRASEGVGPAGRHRVLQKGKRAYRCSRGERDECVSFASGLERAARSRVRLRAQLAVNPAAPAVCAARRAPASARREARRACVRRAAVAPRRFGPSAALGVSDETQALLVQNLLSAGSTTTSPLSALMPTYVRAP